MIIEALTYAKHCFTPRTQVLRNAFTVFYSSIIVRVFRPTLNRREGVSSLRFNSQSPSGTLHDSIRRQFRLHGLGVKRKLHYL